METRQLGTGVDYRSAWDLQRALHAEVAAGTRPGVVLLLEHASVYTGGTGTQPEDRPTDGSEVIDVDRGGRITWHGPGQLVAYPIVRLPDAVRVVDWVRRLEEAVIRALAEFGLQSQRIAGRAGVWVIDDVGERKVGQVGIRVESRTSLHGVSINVRNGSSGFDAIVPCGIADAGVTTLVDETGRDVAPADVGDAFAASLKELIDFAPFTSIAPVTAELALVKSGAAA